MELVYVRLLKSSRSHNGTQRRLGQEIRGDSLFVIDFIEGNRPRFLLTGVEVPVSLCKDHSVQLNTDETLDGLSEEEDGRWFHYWCAVFKRKPTSRGKFICSYCE